MSYKLSFIVPIYNRASLLPRCLDSVLSANRDDVEIILVDDASTDDSVAVAQSYADNHNNVKLIVCEQNGGPGVARNKGLDIASGEFLFFLDSDDMIITENLPRYIDALDINADIILHNTRFLFMGKESNSPAPIITADAIISRDCFFSSHTYDSISMLWACCFNHTFVKQSELRFLPFFHYEDILFLIQAIITARTFLTLREYIYIYTKEGIDNLSDKPFKSRMKSATADVLEYIDGTIHFASKACQEYLLGVRSHILWSGYAGEYSTRPITARNGALKEELTDEIRRFALNLEGITRPIWFMPATCLFLFERFGNLATFSLGGFLDNHATDYNVHTNRLRDLGYTVCRPEDIAHEQNAVVIMFQNTRSFESCLNQLKSLGYRLVVDNKYLGPKLLMNYWD